MSSLRKAKAKKGRVKREKYGGPVKAEEIVVHPPGEVRERIRQMLDLPDNIVNLIFDTTYDTGNGIREPLFKSTGIEIPFIEIQEVIRVYDVFRGLNTDTGREIDIVEQTPIQGETDVNSEVRGLKTISNIPDTGRHRSRARGVAIENTESLAYEKFKHYIETLVKKKEVKVKKNLIIRDDSVYETPMLENIRQEEKIKINLTTRKKKPVKGITCGRCKHDEVHLEEKFVRSGDEGGVFFYKCDTCDHEWKAG